MESEESGRFTIITGEGEQGQNILAMARIERALFVEDQDVYHNGCARGTIKAVADIKGREEAVEFRTFTIRDAALSDPAKFATLLRVAQDESLFVLADGDCIPAIVNAGESASEPLWLAVCRTKKHTVVLTTVRGREYRVLTGIAHQEARHIQVDADYTAGGLWYTVSEGSAGERIPRHKNWADKYSLLRWASLAKGLYECPPREADGLISVFHRDPLIPVDYTAAVRSTETSMPQHPAYPFLLSTTILLGDNQRIRTTEQLVVDWNESVNKRRDEEIAIGIVDWACEKWGISLTDVVPNQASTYPDSKGRTNQCPVNLEVTKVQPAWPSGATFAALTAATREGRAVVPDKAPVISCRECGNIPVPELEDVRRLPNHDPNHFWTCTYPQDMLGHDWEGHITALPELVVGKDQLEQAVANALDRKKGKPNQFGKGEQNWLALIVEGFPLVPGWQEQILGMDWSDFDAVFAVISAQFGSGIYYNAPTDTRVVVIVKCPEQSEHICYHPGHVMWLRKGGSDVDPLRAMDSAGSQGRSMQITDDLGEVLAEETTPPPFPPVERDLLDALRSDRGRREMTLPFRLGQPVL